jgi:predicted Zn-dependent peptidase
MPGELRHVVAACACAVLIAGVAAAAGDWKVPTAVKTLGNGLTIVVSEDHSTPTFGISVVYKVGFRLEPKGRTGFAHLFEHMMFEGTPKAPKGLFSRVIQGGGGLVNGSTRYDYTNYIATAPVSALEPILWLEADRMRDLDFSQENLKNQKDVVKEEIRVNVKNRPYGLFFWTDVSGLAFDKWENAHDGYGSFEDLDAAALQDVIGFHRTYYAPNNAVIGIAGDVKPDEVFALVEKYFGSIPAQPAPPIADVSEQLNTKERTLTQTDQFAKVPGIVVAWKMPPPTSKDYVAAAVLGQLLVAGDASRLYQGLVKGKEILLEVDGGLGWPLGTYLTNNGPSLLIVFGLYKPNTDASAVVSAIQADVEKIAREGVPVPELKRTKTKMLSDFYSEMENLIDRADMLALRQAFAGDASLLNEVPGRLDAVSVDDIKRVAAAYLTTANRSMIDRRPAPAAPAGSAK